VEVTAAAATTATPVTAATAADDDHSVAPDAPPLTADDIAGLNSNIHILIPVTSKLPSAQLPRHSNLLSEDDRILLVDVMRVLGSDGLWLIGAGVLQPTWEWCIANRVYPPPRDSDIQQQWKDLRMQVLKCVANQIAKTFSM